MKAFLWALASMAILSGCTGSRVGPVLRAERVEVVAEIIDGQFVVHVANRDSAAFVLSPNAWLISTAQSGEHGMMQADEDNALGKLFAFEPCTSLRVYKGQRGVVSYTFKTAQAANMLKLSTNVSLLIESICPSDVADAGLGYSVLHRSSIEIPFSVKSSVTAEIQGKGH